LVARAVNSLATERAVVVEVRLVSAIEVAPEVAVGGNERGEAVGIGNAEGRRGGRKISDEVLRLAVEPLGWRSVSGDFCSLVGSTGATLV
jgi:hypothetical protein